MTKISESELSQLYRSEEISEVWNSHKHLKVIRHPELGLISPNQYRARGKDKPCPYCGKKMKHGEDFRTASQTEAIKRGYEYVSANGQKTFNQIGTVFYHPNYVTIDHKINKARCPDKMFDYDNLELICWKCNREKGDDNTYELRHTYDYLSDLVNEALSRYPLL